MLIENNPDILENLTEFLEMEGYKILAANNGKKGLEVAAEFLPDLIICDVLMREMDGYEVLRLLLHSLKTHEIRFIFSSSMSEKVDRTEAMKLGAADYIVKPFELKSLLKIVVVPGFEWVPPICCGQATIAFSHDVKPRGSCRACRSCGSPKTGSTIAWNSCGIPQALGNRFAIPTAPTGPTTGFSFPVLMFV